MNSAITTIAIIPVIFTALCFTIITWSFFSQYPVTKNGKKANVRDKLKACPISSIYPITIPNKKASVILITGGIFLNKTNRICQQNILNKNHNDQCGVNMPVCQLDFPIIK